MINGNKISLKMIKNKNKNIFKSYKIMNKNKKTSTKTKLMKTKQISFHKDTIKKRPYMIKTN
jgi:hypothetical protein